VIERDIYREGENSLHKKQRVVKRWWVMRCAQRRLSGAREMMETTGLFITTILAAYQEMRAARFISSR